MLVKHHGMLHGSCIILARKKLLFSKKKENLRYASQNYASWYMLTRKVSIIVIGALLQIQKPVMRIDVCHFDICIVPSVLYESQKDI